MFKLFLLSHLRLLRMGLTNLWPPRGGLGTRSVRHVLALLVFLPAFYVAFLYQWLGLLLDELLFRGYRRVKVERPVFVLGVPRSGTTFVHEVLADDTRYTTFSTWECFFAASVSWRRLWAAVGRLDRALGRPGGRLLAVAQRRLSGRFEATHPVRLDAPEEDFFALVPVLACFLLVVPFPDSDLPWRMAAFDERMPEPLRGALLRYYRSCIQRHLYHHGPDRVYLSKNASFAPLVGGLLELFPDARIIACVRDPVPTVSSQLSVLQDGLDLFDNRDRSGRFRDRMVDRLHFYYRNLLAHGDALDEARWQWLTLDAVRSDLEGRIRCCYAAFGLPLSAAYARRLAERAGQAAAWRSSHGHRLGDFQLDADRIARRFGFVYERFPSLRGAGPAGSVT